MIPYFPEFLRVSLTADHSSLQGASKDSLWVLPNAGTASVSDIRATATNFLISVIVVTSLFYSFLVLISLALRQSSSLGGRLAGRGRKRLRSVCPQTAFRGP